MTAATQIDVPREFLDGLLVAANIGVMDAAGCIDNGLSVGDVIAERARDGELIAAFSAAVVTRDAFLRAFDEGTPVAGGVLRALAERTVNELHSNVAYLTSHANTDPDELVKASTLLRDFTAWLDGHGLMPVEAVTA